MSSATAIRSQNRVDRHGMPMGSVTRTLGVTLQWHNGPTVRNGKPRLNGASPGSVIETIVDRLKFTQGTEAACEGYEVVIALLEEAQAEYDKCEHVQHPMATGKRAVPLKQVQDQEAEANAKEAEEAAAKEAEAEAISAAADKGSDEDADEDEDDDGEDTAVRDE